MGVGLTPDTSRPTLLSPRYYAKLTSEKRVKILQGALGEEKHYVKIEWL